MKLSKDLRECVALLNSRKIKFLFVGGHAVAYHGLLRFTEDINFLIETSLEDAALVAAPSVILGSRNSNRKTSVNRKPSIQPGRAPNRIDLLTSVTAVTFAEAWETRIDTKLDGLPVCGISKELLVQNKLATGRSRDLADVERIGGKK
jgi:hypothetical protein